MLGQTTALAEDEEALLPTTIPPLESEHEDLQVSMASMPRNIRLSVATNTIQRLLLFMIPSFWRKSHDDADASPREKAMTLEVSKKPSTGYLDGVRGVASVVVFVFHWTHIQFPGVNSGFDGKSQRSVWQLPMLRFVYSGAAMVSIFFAVSGFVLSHRYIQKIHRGELQSLYPSLTSLTFRRAVRLFMPALASCILAFICASFGWMSVPTRVGGKPFHHGFKALLEYVDQESNPWTFDPFMKGFYNPQLWSISLEFRGSMVVFLTVLALAKTRLAVRLVVEVSMVAHAFLHKRWDIALFISGMLIAEIDVLFNERSAVRKFIQRRSITLLLAVAMLLGIWLSGYPRDNGPKSFGYRLLSKGWPHSGYRRRFWVSVGSILIVGPLPFFPKVQAIFNTKLIKYFGQVSFALYLIHGLGNRTIGTWILRTTWSVIGKESFTQAVLSYVVSTSLYVPLIFWWSDMFWRAFDVPSTHFAKWIECQCASRTGT